MQDHKFKITVVLATVELAQAHASKSYAALHHTVYLHMWQPRVEIEHYFGAYFDHIIAFKTP